MAPAKKGSKAAAPVVAHDEDDIIQVRERRALGGTIARVGRRCVRGWAIGGGGGDRWVRRTRARGGGGGAAREGARVSRGVCVNDGVGWWTARMEVGGRGGGARAGRDRRRDRARRARRTGARMGGGARARGRARGGGRWGSVGRARFVRGRVTDETRCFDG